MTRPCESKEGVAFAFDPSTQKGGKIHEAARNQKLYSKPYDRVIITDLVAAPHVAFYSSSWSQKVARPEPQRHQEEQIIISR